MNPSTIASDISDVLERHGVPLRIDADDITVTDRTVSDLVKAHPRLSYAITEHLWPRVPAAECFHYTTHEKALAILASGQLRLTSIAKRLSEGEIVQFCKSNHLLGYLERDSSGVPYYEHSLSPHLFYTSFTSTELQPDEEEYFWREFAHGDGVRLRIRVTAQNPNFRRIVYETSPGTPIPVLADLMSTVLSRHGRHLILRGLSYLCAFNLGVTLSHERELRALYRVYQGFGPQPDLSETYPFISVPFGSESETGYRFDLLEYHSTSSPQLPAGVTFSDRTL